MRKTKKQRQEARDSRERTRFYRVIYVLFAWLIGLLFRIRVVGRENLPEDGGYVVCANHNSALDPIFLCYAFRNRQMRLMAKKELFSIPLLGWLIKGLGAFPVDRKNNDVGAIRHGVELVKKGRCLCIFPQGHRNPGVDPRTTKVKNGAAMIAVKGGADFLPIYILCKNNRPGLFRKTTVIIGEPLRLSELGYDPEASGEYARISGILFDRICGIGEKARAEGVGACK